MNRPEAIEKPRQSVASLWNISFGFLGIQVGFALQTANMSRIFQSLGSSLDDLPVLWIAAPLTGLLVQPIVGHLSDRTWLGRIGRRRPYFLAGALLAALSLVLMPLSSSLLMAAVLLWMLDASLNISMEPFRAFVGDMLRKDQHTAGYAVQTAFIGVGAVIGSIFPWLLDKAGASNLATAGIPDTVRYSFWFGGAALFLAVLWTVISTREYSPEEMAGLWRSGRACGGRTDGSCARQSQLRHQHPVDRDWNLHRLFGGRMGARKRSLPARRAIDRLRSRQRRRDRVGTAGPYRRTCWRTSLVTFPACRMS